MAKTMKTICMMLALLLAVQAQAQTETLKVWMDNVTMTADGQTVTRLYVHENDVVDYTAFSLSLSVPKGVTIAKVKSGRNYVNDIRLTERLNDHTISCNILSDVQTIKIISSSPSNSNFYPDDADGNLMDSIFSIGLIADPTMVNGDYTVEIKDCKFVLTNAAASQPSSPVTATMTVTGGQEGMNISYTMTEVGMGTLILPFDAELPEGLHAFRCTGLDGNTVVADEQTSIKANTPLLMTGAAGTYTFTGTSTATETSYKDGVLTGVLKQTSVSEGYVLQNLNNRLGFYIINANKPVTVPAYRCFMNSQDGVEYMGVKLNPATGIDGIESEKDATDNVYDLQGRKVKKTNARKGVYILNGEKIIVK